jgi:RNA recognition motif-containing protein
MQENMSQADQVQTTNMSINQDNPFQLAKNVNSEVYGRKSTCGKEVTPKVLVPSALKRKSNSYFPQTQNRLSSLSNQLSEISEVVEDKNSQTVNMSFDTNIGFQMPVAQRYSLQNTISPSFTVEESEELKVPYNSRKIFVGGLPHGITEPEFTQYFSQYGEIED